MPGLDLNSSETTYSVGRLRKLYLNEKLLSEYLVPLLNSGNIADSASELRSQTNTVCFLTRNDCVLLTLQVRLSEIVVGR